jgi:hypothetical protein
MKKYNQLVIIFIGVIVSVTLFSSMAANAGKARSDSANAQLGIRYLNSVPEDLQIGQTIKANIINPERLTKFGLQSRSDDLLELKLVEKNKIQVKNTRTGLSIFLFFGENGILSPAAR